MGIDCLLISTNQAETPYPVYPLGVAHLAGALQAAGHRAHHYDLLAQGGYEGLKERLARTPPHLIGLSLRNLDTEDSTAPTSFLDGAKELMAFLRRHSSAPVVLGGPAFSILPEEVLALLGADYGVVGEGETLLTRLADRIEEQGRPPAGTVFRAVPGETAWQPVAYDRATAGYYLARGGMLNVQTKRGCPHQCAYCSYPSLEGRRMRCREPEAVADDVLRAARDFDARYIFFTDSVFNDAKGHYLEVAEALVRAGNKTPWCAFFRPGNMTRENLTLLQKAGLAAMEIGTDAVTDKTLAALHKGFGFDEVAHTNELTTALKIPTVHFLIFGGPDEDETTLKEGLANVEKLKGAATLAFSGIRILPGTAVHERAVAEGRIEPGRSLLAPVFYFSPRLAREKLEKTIQDAWDGRFDRVYPSASLQRNINRLHKRGHTGPLWDLLI